MSTLGSSVAKRNKAHLTSAKNAVALFPRNHKLHPKIKTGNESRLTVYAVANWDGEAGSRRKSDTGIVIIYGKAPVYVASCNQKSILLSSPEADYMAV